MRAAFLAGLWFCTACNVFNQVPTEGDCVLSPPPQCEQATSFSAKRVPVIIDTDAQFGGAVLEGGRRFGSTDQWAIAYVLLHGDYFDLRGITTVSPGGASTQPQIEEAQRITDLCGLGQIPIKAGPSQSYGALVGSVSTSTFDGAEAVDFIVEESKRTPGLTVLSLARATNVALALAADPTLAGRISVYWFGGDQIEGPFIASAETGPSKGKFNLDGDPDAAIALLNSSVPLSILPNDGAGGALPVSGLNGAVVANARCQGPRIVPPVVDPAGNVDYTIGQFMREIYGFQTFHGTDLWVQSGVVPVAFQHSELVQVSTVPAFGYDPATGNFIAQPGNARSIKLVRFLDSGGQAINDMTDALYHYTLACPQ